MQAHRSGSARASFQHHRAVKWHTNSQEKSYISCLTLSLLSRRCNARKSGDYRPGAGTLEGVGGQIMNHSERGAEVRGKGSPAGQPISDKYGPGEMSRKCSRCM
ncbi:hypothetical protein Bbelb_047410 [Branchiostoma belcheri]|nr:hypothetical protein Bbelb_047410 [Branchiostoma belcheri]